MSETAEAGQEQVTPPAQPGEGATAGRLLREAREAAGLHVATLAVSLKVPVRKLEALEDDRYDQLPDLVFVRALASSICRTLKIDPQPILERLPQGNRPRLVQDDDGINAPFRVPGENPRPSWMDQLGRPVTITVIVLLLGAVALMLWPGRHGDDAAPAARADAPGAAPASLPPQAVASSEASAAAAAGAEPASAPVAPQAGTDTVAGAPAGPASAAPAAVAVPASPSTPVVAPAAAPALVASASQPAASAAVAARPMASQPVLAAASAPAAAASGAGSAAPGIVVFRAKAQSWVQVSDAKGNPVLRKLLMPGESASAGGVLPLSVTVGSAQSTEVEVRGQPYDLGPLSRDNVARFQVK